MKGPQSLDALAKEAALLDDLIMRVLEWHAIFYAVTSDHPPKMIQWVLPACSKTAAPGSS